MDHHPAAGATGEFPLVKAHPDELGGLDCVMSINRARGTVILDFGKRPVTFVEMTAIEAHVFAGLLMERADSLEKK
jgi:hypothetical protein